MCRAILSAWSSNISRWVPPKSNVTTADVVDQLSKAEQCRNLAELFKRKSGLKTYIDNFEVGDIALEFIDVDPPPSYEGELGWMTHGKRTR